MQFIYRGLIVLCIVLVSCSPAFSRAAFDRNVESSSEPVVNPFKNLSHASQLQQYAVHDAGALFTFFSSDGRCSEPDETDPETGHYMSYSSYPYRGDNYYLFQGALWVGGILNNDTLVSVGTDGWARGTEFLADNIQGGTTRTGIYADDEFVTVFTDTLYQPLQPMPLWIEVTRQTYSWSDSRYDDFVIMGYHIRNIGINNITQGYAGYYMDGDIMHSSNQQGGFQDDISGVLHTLLYDDDFQSNVLIPYMFDNDGDPEGDVWGATSVPDVISLRLLDANFPIENINFNWWIPNGAASLDFGPRQLEEPFYHFKDSVLGTPTTDGDIYYMLSHPEIDFDQIECASIDSGDGWVPPQTPAQATDFADGYDTRFLLSFGPFDLAPGDTATFWLAMVAAPGLHSNPNDFSTYFDPYNPDAFRNTLSLDSLMLYHRRADSVYQSGFMLPNPGAPTGLIMTDYNAGTVSIDWDDSQRPDWAGYNVYYHDTTLVGPWTKQNTVLISISEYTFDIPDPSEPYWVAVTQKDAGGRESVLSPAVITGPSTISGLTISTIGLTINLDWDDHSDASVVKYYIYRKVGEPNPLYEDLYDSTLSSNYWDLNTESGTFYYYRVSAINSDGLSSPLSAQIGDIPMAMDQGVLFYDMNRVPYIGFDTSNVNELYDSLLAYLPVERINDKDSALSYKSISNYSTVIFMGGTMYGFINVSERDMVTSFINKGGSVIISALTMASTSTSSGSSIMYGDYNQQNYWRLYSYMHQGLVMTTEPNEFHGDLIGCESILSAVYPELVVDTNKLMNSIYPIIGGMPMSGYLFPGEGTEPLYTYQSLNPDTVNHGQINGYRLFTDDYRMVVFNFPLHVMEAPNNFYALRRALADIGEIELTNCGDVNDDELVNIGDAVYLINYVFREGIAPDPLCIGDANNDGLTDVGDAVYLIAFIFRDGAPPEWNCCSK